MSHRAIIKYLWQKFWEEMKKKIFGPFGFQNPKSEFRVPYTPSLVFLLPVYFKMTPKKKLCPLYSIIIVVEQSKDFVAG